MSLLLVSPVAGGQGIAQSVGDDASLHGQLEVEVLALVDELLRIHSHFLHEVAEETAEEERQQGSSKVQALVAVMVCNVVLLG